MDLIALVGMAVIFVLVLALVNGVVLALFDWLRKREDAPRVQRNR